MIYQVYDAVDTTINYICPDQTTIDQGKTMGYVGNFVIGQQTDADILLESFREKWSIANATLLVVNKDIDPDPVQTTWIPCDLNTETPNIDQDYNIFDVINGYYTLVTGLDNAKSLFAITQENAEQYCVPNYISFETWKPMPFGPTQGVQTL